MYPILPVILFIVPVVLLIGSAVILASRSRSKGFSVKRTMGINLLTFLVVMVVACGFTYSASAKDVQPDVQSTETTATAAAETEETAAPASANAASNESMGLGLLAAALSNTTQRSEALTALWRDLLDNAPFLPVCFKATSVLATEGVVEGLAPTETDVFRHLDAWRIHLDA